MARTKGKVTEFNAQGERDYVIDFAKVKRYFADICDGVTTTKQPHLQSKVAVWSAQCARKERSNGRNSWEGGTAYEMREFFRTGYKGKGISKVKLAVPDQEKPKTVWAEEGEELDLFKAYSGDPTPFSSKQNPIGRPGLRVVIDFAMSASTNSTVIEQFGSWIAALTETLQKAGYDLDLDARIRVRSLYRGSDSAITNVNIRLKKMGKMTDFAAWSPMFAPAGFRQLGFVAMFLSADHYGKTADSSLGFPSGANDWGVRWDKDTRTMYLDSPSYARAFDADKMTAGVKATGLLA